MNYTDYSQFYDVVISLLINEVLERLSASISTQKKTKCCVKVRKNAKDRIFRHYQKKRDEVKNYYMHKSVVALDSHKVAACLMYSILKSKPILINRFIKNLPEEAIMANEYVAVFVALNVVDNYRQKRTTDFRTVVPSTYHDDLDKNKNEYIPNFCKALHFIKNIKYFDIFAYANILFMLEKYTDSTATNDRRSTS